MRVIRKNLWPLVAIVLLVAAAAVVGTYVLGQERFRFPFTERPVLVNVELDNAQAVTPGQGQTAQVAGVQIGRIGKVRLAHGRAIVALEIEPRYADLIHRDARALLRPRTGLKDMYVQILPGRQGRPVHEGFTIPVANTTTDVDLDEILSELDPRTRDYVTLLIGGAGRGLRRRGDSVAETFRRFSPTFRDLGRVSKAVGRERIALRRLVTSLAQITAKLAQKPRHLTQLVDTAATTMHAFASEDVNLRDSVTELAPALSQATSTLRAVGPFAQQLAPTTRALVPAVRRLDEANAQVRPFAREAAPIVRSQIRPFVRRARPLVRDLRPAARGLSRTFPELKRSATVLNHLANMAAFNPDGREGPGRAAREEGYLFWLAWATHQGINLQNVDDANGPLRPIFVTGTCTTLTTLVNDTPQLEFALGLSPLLASACKNPSTSSLDKTTALRRTFPKKGRR
ncbi:MAG: MlaD family protein [Actinomycetota bacterium]|nr:MlaD family protein [Actinomycetota bacterium]